MCSDSTTSARTASHYIHPNFSVILPIYWSWDWIPDHHPYHLDDVQFWPLVGAPLETVPGKDFPLHVLALWAVGHMFGKRVPDAGSVVWPRGDWVVFLASEEQVSYEVAWWIQIWNLLHMELNKALETTLFQLHFKQMQTLPEPREVKWLTQVSGWSCSKARPEFQFSLQRPPSSHGCLCVGAQVCLMLCDPWM